MLVLDPLSQSARQQEVRGAKSRETEISWVVGENFSIYLCIYLSSRTFSRHSPNTPKFADCMLCIIKPSFIFEIFVDTVFVRLLVTGFFGLYV